MPVLTFPDGNQKPSRPASPARRSPKSISKSLAKKAIAMKLDGVLSDLSDEVAGDARIEIVTRDSPEALDLIRHDAAHVMAEAVQALHPGTQVTIGPVIENGFYYDFFRNEPFTPDDFPAIEAKMREIIAQERALHRRRSGAATRPARSSATRARPSRSSSSTPSRKARTSRSTTRMAGSTSAAALTWSRPARSARPSS